MKSKRIRFCCWLICTLLLFTMLFIMLQIILTPTFPENGNEGFYSLEDNSIHDVVFIGPSQMFCTVDPSLMRNDYNISSCDFGANSQLLPISYYYLQEMLKHQSPRLVMVEICYIFNSKETISEAALAWNYSQMPTNADKFQSLKDLLNDPVKAFEYCYLPLLVYHTRWSSLKLSDLSKPFNKHTSSSPYGFQGLEKTEPIELQFQADDSAVEKIIPEENKQAIMNILDLCHKNGINVVFFKSPSGNWTKSESVCVKRFMEENNIPFLEMHDHLSEIGINPNSDFANATHLNTDGAKKVSTFLAKYILSSLNNIQT